MQQSPIPDPEMQPLLATLGQLIAQARQQAVRAVDVIQVQTCWDIGRHIVEFEQGGATRARYGQRLLPTLARTLTAEYGKGFDATNLRHMRAFFLAFPIRDALRRELSWTHYRSLLKLDKPDARTWYMHEAADQNWSTRALDRQMGTLYYERLLVSQDRAAVQAEATSQTAALSSIPRAFVRDPVMLEFLGLPHAGRLLECGIPCCTAMNSCLPASTSWCCPAKKNFGPNWSASGRCWMPSRHYRQRIFHKP